MIGLDPGHGGRSKGAEHNGITEADWNMAFCRMIHREIGGESVLLRTRDDEDVGLLERGRRSYDAGCDLVICVHVNASKNASWHGLLAFYLPDDPVARELSNTMMRSAPKPLYKPGWQAIPATDEPGPQDDWLERPRNVMSVHSCPAPLLEVGYCSHLPDAVALDDDDVHDGLVAMVLLALARFEYLHARH